MFQYFGVSQSNLFLPEASCKERSNQYRHQHKLHRLLNTAHTSKEAAEKLKNLPIILPMGLTLSRVKNRSEWSEQAAAIIGSGALGFFLKEENNNIEYKTYAEEEEKLGWCKSQKNKQISEIAREVNYDPSEMRTNQPIICDGSWCNDKSGIIKINTISNACNWTNSRKDWFNWLILNLTKQLVWSL